MSERLSRRQFFSLNLEATVGFLGNFFVPQLELDREFFRPPGTSSELDFLTTCNRCGLCKDSCPENIIKLFSLSQGARLANSPYIDPNESPCTFCKKCIDICPTGALHEQASNRIGYAKINIPNCIAYKEVMCAYCVDACPQSDAIYLQNGKPMINKEKCSGCGLCVSSCITDTKGIYVVPSTTHA